jgi:hypothetical protein
MRRRDFITFLSGATAWAAAARAQKPQRVIGVLGSASYGAFPGPSANSLLGWRRAMRYLQFIHQGCLLISAV